MQATKIRPPSVRLSKNHASSIQAIWCDERSCCQRTLSVDATLWVEYWHGEEKADSGRMKRSTCKTDTSQEKVQGERDHTSPLRERNGSSTRLDVADVCQCLSSLLLVLTPADTARSNLIQRRLHRSFPEKWSIFHRTADLWHTSGAHGQGMWYGPSSST